MNRREFLQRGFAAAGSLIAPQTIVAASPVIAEAAAPAAAAAVIPASFPWMKDIWFPSISSLESVMMHRNLGAKFEPCNFKLLRKLQAPAGLEVTGFGEWTTELLLWADGKTKKEIREGIEREKKGQIQSDAYNSIENRDFCDKLLKLFDHQFSSLEDAHIFTESELSTFSQQISQIANDILATVTERIKEIEPVLKEDLLSERTEKFAQDPLLFQKLDITPEVYMSTPYTGYLLPFKLKICLTKEAGESPLEFDQRTKDMAEFLVNSLCENIEIEQRGARNGVIYLKAQALKYPKDHNEYYPGWPNELMERMEECLEKQQKQGRLI